MVFTLINEWMKAFDPVKDDESFIRYANLIREESSELSIAVADLETSGTLSDAHKEAADLVWVAVCQALHICTPAQLEKALLAVYNSNMSKRCGDEFHAQEWIAQQDMDNVASVHHENGHYVIRRNVDGKVLKGPNYVEANITIEDE